MSFDVFAQGFRDGELSSEGWQQVFAVLRPYMRAAPEDPAHLALPEGGADIYWSTRGAMVNHVKGAGVWDLVVKAAAAGGWTLLAVGLPALLPNEALREHLPEDLRKSAVVVASGEDFERLLRAH